MLLGFRIRNGLQKGPWGGKRQLHFAEGVVVINVDSSSVLARGSDFTFLR